MKSPFKFLDSYTKDDRAIFFGRDREIEELYHRVFESKLMLVYGVSGTGKSSLIHCGLANKFQETDWLPLMVRRGGNIIESTATVIKAVSITPQDGQLVTPVQFKKAVRSLYLDHYKPVFFIFDQFEELFIFGDKDERKLFVQIIKSLVESDLQCRLIFVMREEYMAGVTEFEKYITTFFSNRVRIEKMSHINALEAIKEPCKVFNISLEDGFAEALLEKLSPGSAEVELTYLQVFLDKVFRLACTNYPPSFGHRSLGEGVRGGQGGHDPTRGEAKRGASFTLELLSQIGNVSDLLGSFLDEQISLLEDPQTGLSILKTFVSLKGTRKQLSEEAIQDSSRLFGKEILPEIIKEYLQQFVNLRILKEKNEAGNYELRHDSLAEKIYGKISMMEKELLEVMNFLETANQQYEKRGAFLSEDDLKYIQYFEDKQILRKNKKFTGLIDLSKKYHTGKKRKRRQLVTGLTAFLIIILSSLSIWAINQRSKALQQKNIAETQKNKAILAKQEAQSSRNEADIARLEAEKQKMIADSSAKIAIDQKYKADNARQIAENELYRNVRNSLSISAEAMNVMYMGIKNPVTVTVSGIPSEKLIVKTNNGKIEKGKVKRSSGDYFEGDYLVTPASSDNLVITIYGEMRHGRIDSIGNKIFRVKMIPDPYATFAGKTGDIIIKEEALATKMLVANIGMDFDLRFIIQSFSASMIDQGFDYVQSSNNNLLTQGQLSLIQRINHGKKLYIENIKAIGPDGTIRDIPPLIFTIYDSKSAIETDNDVFRHKAAMDFYYEANNYRDYQEKEIFLNKSMDIFEAIKDRKPDDMIDELFILTLYYTQLTKLSSSDSESEKSKNLFQQINSLMKKIVEYKWQVSDIDTVLIYNNKLNFARNANPVPIRLGLPDFVLQLTERFIQIPGIRDEQKKYIFSFCAGLGEIFLYDSQFEKSLKAYQVSSLVSSPENFDFHLPLVLVLNNRYSEAEKIYIAWKDKPWTINESAKTYGEAFLSNLIYFEGKGITHPDFAKVKELLKK